MGIFEKLERRLAGGVNHAFAKAFRSEVQPVELASAVRSAMDERAAHVGRAKRPVVPNLFDIELSATDYDRLIAHEDELTDELRASATEHAETQRYTPGGPMALRFSRNPELETGVFRMRPRSGPRMDDVPAPRFGRHAEPDLDPEPVDPGPVVGARDGDEDDLALWQTAYGGSPRRAAGDARSDDGFDDAVAGQDDPGRRDADRPDDHRPDDDRSDDDGIRDVGERGGPVRRFALPGPRHDEAPAAEYEQPTHAAPHARPATPYDPHRPSPAAPRRVRERPWLDLDGERYPLIGAITVIGRDDDADIILDDPGVSRRHAEVRVTTDGPHLVVTLRDLQSTNGTFVDGEQITRHHLSSAQRVTVGRSTFVFHPGGDR